jgi:tyrosinase
MTKSELPRRDFLSGLGIAGGLSLLGAAGTADAQIFPLPKRCPQAGAKIRKNFKTLTAAELTAFKNGVAAMKARDPIADPTSWGYQAAIHGTMLTNAKTAWNTCQHNTTFFLSWHRMYLCFFERILRKASGNANFGLPYWNYTDTTDPNARALPSAFWTPANSSNPLYESNRSSSANSGVQISASAVAIAGPMALLNFYPFSSSLSGTPHGAVHVSIGGGMGSVKQAALDPIFWMHHCNIDRLWNRWLSLGGGRQNPTTDATWLYTKFTFFDENKVPVTMTGSDILNDNCTMCKSCYDEETVIPNWQLPFDHWTFTDIMIGRLSFQPLGEGTLRFVIELDNELKNSLAQVKSAARPNAPVSVKLNFEDVRLNKPAEFYYEVYIDLPADIKDPDFRIDRYAGNISFFGADDMHDHDLRREGNKFSLYITDAVASMAARGVGGKQLSITMVPTATSSADGRRIPVVSDVIGEVSAITVTIEEARR